MLVRRELITLPREMKRSTAAYRANKGRIVKLIRVSKHCVWRAPIMLGAPMDPTVWVPT